MKFLYFKSPKGNFGDDLNPWLWSRLFKDTAIDDNTYFVGIGSILHNNNSSLKDISKNKKIVFGTGIRPSKAYDKFSFDETWDVRFLRGPLSSQVLGNKYKYISDSAYAIRQIKDFGAILSQEKKYEVSLMPYFHSVKYFDWKALCDKLGYHYISPHSENGVEQTLLEIAQSKILITEAMHGAILADALRVPWHRYVLSTPHTEGSLVSEFKWNDWLQSINIYDANVTFVPFLKKGFLNKFFQKISLGIISAEFLYKKGVIRDLIAKLSNIPMTNLSSDDTIAEIDKKMKSEINRLLEK